MAVKTRAASPQQAPAQAGLTMDDVMSVVMGAAATAKKGGKADDKRVVVLTEEQAALAKQYAKTKKEADDLGDLADAVKQQLLAESRPEFLRQCELAREALSSVTLLCPDGSKLTMTVKNKYSAIPLAEKPGQPDPKRLQLQEAFGEDFPRYFTQVLSITINPASANDPRFLKELMDAVGPEFFVRHFTPKASLAVTDALHNAILTDPDVRAQAQPLIDQAVLKPESPSFRVQ